MSTEVLSYLQNINIWIKIFEMESNEIVSQKKSSFITFLMNAKKAERRIINGFEKGKVQIALPFLLHRRIVFIFLSINRQD